MTFGTWRWWGFQPHVPAAFTLRKCSWYWFSLGAETTPRPWYGRKECVTEKASDTTGNRYRDRRNSSALTTTLPQAPYVCMYLYIYTLNTRARTHTHTHIYICMCVCVYIYIQGDQKVSVPLMITIQYVTNKVQSVPRHSPDIYWHAELFSKTVFRKHGPHSECILWWPSSNTVFLSVFYIVIVRCTETFLSPFIYVTSWHCMSDFLQSVTPGPCVNALFAFIVNFWAKDQGKK
jgi:hypothetical protein